MGEVGSRIHCGMEFSPPMWVYLWWGALCLLPLLGSWASGSIWACLCGVLLEQNTCNKNSVETGVFIHVVWDEKLLVQGTRLCLKLCWHCIHLALGACPISSQLWPLQVMLMRLYIGGVLFQLCSDICSATVGGQTSTPVDLSLPMYNVLGDMLVLAEDRIGN